MSARHHTPGPWNRGYGQNVYQGEHADPTGRQRLIATCEPSSRTEADWEETWANATLIAAAPALLEAAKRAAYLMAELPGHLEPQTTAARQALVDAIKAADPAYYGEKI